MSPDDGYDDVRVLLRGADPGPRPDLDVDEILRTGARLRRRSSRDRWLAAAAAVLVLAGAGVVVAQLGRGQDAAPADPVVPSQTSTFAPTPISPDQWLLYSQVGIDEASSVHYVGELGTTPDGVTVTVDTVLGRSTAQGSVSADGVTSRYLTVGGETYVEPAVLVRLGLMTADAAGSATWVRLSAPEQSRFRVPTTVQGAINLADYSRWAPAFAASRMVDGRPTTAVSIDATQLAPGARLQTFYVDAQAPHLPRLVERDGRPVARLTDWNAPVPTPVVPPESEVAEVPGL